jgi:hypothetical protein
VTYKRVLPRDLFNESKLLKCLGQVALHAENDVVNLWISHRDKEKGFLIDQDPSDGSLFCSNLKIHTMAGCDLRLYSPYGSRDPYPLYFVDQTNDEEPEQEVFNNDGSFTAVFLAYVKKE